MPTIPAGYGQANFQFTGPQCPTGAEFTMGFNHGTFGGSPTAAAVLLAANWVANIRTSTSNDCTLSTVLVKFGPNDVGPSGITSPGSPGSLTGSAMSPAVALLVQKVTDLGGRAGRGRLYSPGLEETHVDDQGRITVAALPALQAAWTAFRNKMVTDDLEPVLLHEAGSPIVLPTLVTELRVDAIVATQRRRQRR